MYICHPIIEPNELSKFLRLLILITLTSESVLGIIVIFIPNLSAKSVYIMNDLFCVILLLLLYLTYSYHYSALFVVSKTTLIFILLVSLINSIWLKEIQNSIFCIIAISFHSIIDLGSWIIGYLSYKEFKGQFFEGNVRFNVLSFISENNIYPPSIYITNRNQRNVVQNLLGGNQTRINANQNNRAHRRNQNRNINLNQINLIDNEVNL